MTAFPSPALTKIQRRIGYAVKATKVLGHQDQRLMSNAFVGELIPQDTAGEPAKTLLARIREAWAIAPKGGRGRMAKA